MDLNSNVRNIMTTNLVDQHVVPSFDLNMVPMGGKVRMYDCFSQSTIGCGLHAGIGVVSLKKALNFSLIVYSKTFEISDFFDV